jgi:hypothetical protein
VTVDAKNVQAPMLLKNRLKKPTDAEDTLVKYGAELHFWFLKV